MSRPPGYFASGSALRHSGSRPRFSGSGWRYSGSRSRYSGSGGGSSKDICSEGAGG